MYSQYKLFENGFLLITKTKALFSNLARFRCKLQVVLAWPPSLAPICNRWPDRNEGCFPAAVQLHYIAPARLYRVVWGKDFLSAFSVHKLITIFVFNKIVQK
jgi:hypothetical protein